MRTRASRGPRFASSLYLVLLVGEAVFMAVVPLLPVYEERLGLSGAEAGALVAAPGLTMVLAAMPAGDLADRLGPRRVTVWSAALLAVTALAQAVAPSFVVLLLVRALFGLAMGAVWTAGTGWLAATSSESEVPAALGKTLTAAGIGVVIGPAVAGLLASAFGLAAPFLLGGAVAAALAVRLAVVAKAETERLAPAAPRVSLRRTVRLATRTPALLAAGGSLAVSGGMNTGLSVLVPRQLSAHGLSEARIGLVFAGASLLFIGTSALLVRRARGVVGLGALGLTVAAMVVSMAPGVVSSAVAPAVVVLCAAAVGRGVLGTLAYPVAAVAAPGVGLGQATVIGLMNSLWGAAAVAAPLLAGGAADLVGAPATYGLLQALIVVGGVAIVLRIRTLRRAEQSLGSSYQRPIEIAGENID
jgi:predicted MFS family arabinose efflux permease